jgi:EmrB/QacA subfamily drug resistance transporter
MTSPDLRMGTARGRWVVAAAVLGSGIAFLDGTVVNAALPAIADDLHANLGDLQWVLTGYLLTLGSLLVLGGSLGDRYGRRRIFVIGLVAFAATSLLCAVAPDTGSLIAARCAQGVAAALLVPNSLAIVSASFATEDRGRAIGAWSGLGGIATAIGPFLGGYLIDSVSWRWVFVINLPIAAAAAAIVMRHVPESRDEHAGAHLDVAGSALLTVGLAGLVYALIEGPSQDWPAAAIGFGLVGILALAGFLMVEATTATPMVPLGIFRSQQFSGANAVTFAVYAALGAVTFLLVVHLQTDLGYSALEAGAALLPITVCMLLLSVRAGALAQRIGPRWPMTIGPLIVAVGMVLLSRVEPGSTYWTTVFPGILVLGLGLSLTVAPLTATVLGAVDDSHAGIASAINNSVARIAGLLAVAVLPAAAGMSAAQGLDLVDGFARAMDISAALAALGGVLASFTIREAAFVEPVARPNPAIPCYDTGARVAGSAR